MENAAEKKRFNLFKEVGKAFTATFRTMLKCDEDADELSPEENAYLNNVVLKTHADVKAAQVNNKIRNINNKTVGNKGGKENTLNKGAKKADIQEEEKTDIQEQVR